MGEEGERGMERMEVWRRGREGWRGGRGGEEGGRGGEEGGVEKRERGRGGEEGETCRHDSVLFSNLHPIDPHPNILSTSGDAHLDYVGTLCALPCSRPAQHKHHEWLSGRHRSPHKLRSHCLQRTTQKGHRSCMHEHVKGCWKGYVKILKRGVVPRPNRAEAYHGKLLRKARDRKEEIES